jgi:hypothetical protein
MPASHHLSRGRYAATIRSNARHTDGSVADLRPHHSNVTLPDANRTPTKAVEHQDGIALIAASPVGRWHASVTPVSS